MPFNVCYNNQKYYLENNSNDKQYKNWMFVSANAI